MSARLASSMFVFACSTNPTTPPPDRPKESVAPPVVAPRDAALVALQPDVDAMLPDPKQQELEDAFDSLGSEDGHGVRHVDWWRENAERVRPRLRAMLEGDEDNSQYSNWAFTILGDIGDPADVDVLAKVLTTWKSETARTSAAHALGKLRGPAATDALIAATKLDNTDTVGYAASALGDRKQEAAAARARLEELIDHVNPTVRYRAVNSLRDLGGAKKVLAKRKKIEKDAEVRAAITKALKAK